MSEHDYESKIAEGHHRLVRERELTHTSRLIGQQNFSSIQRYVVLDIIPDPTIIDDAKIEYYKSKF